jgi:hypothetical protein
MSLYQITGYIQIPVTATVEAERVEDALEIGRDLIEGGIGEEGDQFLSDRFYLSDSEGNPVGQAEGGELSIEFTHIGHA